MRTSELILSIVAANNDRIDGKTTMQKLVYFSEQFHIPLKDAPTFRPHFFGPYSAEVDFQLDKLAGLGFLEASAHATVNDRLIYSYKLTPEGREVLESIKQKNSREQEAVAGLVKKIKAAGALNPSTLSYAAKVHHILSKSEKSVTVQEVITQAKDFGWQIDEKDVQTGAKLLTALRLAQTRK